MCLQVGGKGSSRVVVMQAREVSSLNPIAKFAHKESFHDIGGNLRREVYPQAMSHACKQSCGGYEGADVWIRP